MARTQEDILLSLIQNDSGSTFASENPGWSADVHACQWEGIGCNTSDQVVRINLTGYSLQGTIPPELSELSYLRDLILSNCGLQGTIPESIARMTTLEEVSLRLNELTGELPPFESTRLTVLTLGHNRLTGPLPRVGHVDMPDLITLDFEDNQLTGNIPLFFSNFESLREVNLARNQLSGEFPDTLPLQQIPVLERLFVSENRLTGTLPPTVHDSLTELHCQNNQLTGTVPSTLSTAPELKVLLIHGNRLIGEIPQSLCDMDLNAELVDDTHVGDGGRNRRLESDFVMNSYGPEECNRIACPAWFHSDSGRAPCAPCHSKSINPYIGATSCIQISEKEVLGKFYDATNGEQWSDWNLADESICFRSGITCTAEGKVERMKFANKNLSGTLPLELGFLEHLVELDVSHNSLEGHVPEELSLPPLEVLDLAENMLTGYVPEALCLKEGVNGNGQDGEFSCDVITCRMGSFHKNGRADAGRPGAFCDRCVLVDGHVLGNTNCASIGFSREDDVTPTNDASVSQWIKLAGVMLVGVIFVLASVITLKRVGRNRVYAEDGSEDDRQKSETATMVRSSTGSEPSRAIHVFA